MGLWDLAFLAFAHPPSSNRTATSISSKLWPHLARYSDPNGPRVPRPGQWTVAWHTDGLVQRSTIWYTAPPFTDADALRPYTLQQMLRGCKVLSAGDSQALRIQNNLTGVPAQYMPVAIALDNLVQADGAPVDGRRRFGE